MFTSKTDLRHSQGTPPRTPPGRPRSPRLAGVTDRYANDTSTRMITRSCTDCARGPKVFQTCSREATHHKQT
eukprot:10227073-Heterocapsa_arctica.AAC.1